MTGRWKCEGRTRAVDAWVARGTRLGRGCPWDEAAQPTTGRVDGRPVLFWAGDCKGGTLCEGGVREALENPLAGIFIFFWRKRRHFKKEFLLLEKEKDNLEKFRKCTREETPSSCDSQVASELFLFRNNQLTKNCHLSSIVKKYFGTPSDYNIWCFENSTICEQAQGDKLTNRDKHCHRRNVTSLHSFSLWLIWLITR